MNSSQTRFSLLALVFLLASLTASGTADELKSEPSSAELHSASEGAIQSINSYLTDVGPLSMDPSGVVQHLQQARALIDAGGDEIADEHSEYDSSLESLFRDHPDSLRPVLDSLIKASKSCDQKSIDFIALLKSQTFVGQFLHNYSLQLENICHGVGVGIVADKVEKSLGKVNAEIYELVADLAQRYVARDKKLTASRGRIVISDNQKSVDQTEVLRTLKQVKLDTVARQSLFAIMIRNYYAEEFPTEEGARDTANTKRERLRDFFIESLMDPCNELTERWFGTINYPGFVKIPKRRIIETIEARRKNNPSLDRSVEMIRICHEIKERANQILAVVEK